jgi:hypothetical protein
MEQRMTSLDIAEVTGKDHKNVLQAIRNMEPAWEKVHGLKFQPMQIRRDLPNGGYRMIPAYSLTADYEQSGLAQDRSFHYYALDGEKKERKYLVWTAEGVEFIRATLRT